MASCAGVAIPSYALGPAAKQRNGLRRSESGKEICKRGAGRMRRSCSDGNLCYSVNRTRAESTSPKLKGSRHSSAGFFPFQFQLSSSMIPDSLRAFLLDPETSKDMSIGNESEGFEEEEDMKIKKANWVERLMQIRREWVNRQQQEGDSAVDGGDEDEQEDEKGDCDTDGCEVDYDSDEDEGGEIKYDRKSFSRLLEQVPLSDTKLFSQLAFLSNMAYAITEIKANDLKRHYGLQFVTSSLEKKAEVAVVSVKLELDSTRVTTSNDPSAYDTQNCVVSELRRPIRPSVATKIAASAASYVQSLANDLTSAGCEPVEEEGVCETEEQRRGDGGNSHRVYKSEVAAYVAASTMTAVVAAGEKEKQEAAKDLQSLHSSPCEWFICDDFSTYTRCFAIQGSDSLASWQANLFFEPTKFEGTDVLVHRGIYEAAKGLYEQFMPEIMDHLNRHGERAKLQFTGHSLGGSLSLLVNLMLLTRGVVKPSALRPVVTFGSPSVFCGGQKLLRDLELDENHVHSVMMHRDIVPRAFSCNYPDHIALLLRRLNGTFRSHPCLNKNKCLYSPLGKLFILQPNEKSSPSHPLLPPGNALYALDKTKCGYSASALRSFLNCPHPLETLSYPTAYGSDGTILRDHDSSNYLKAVLGVLRQRSRPSFCETRRKQKNMLWPLLTSPSPHSWSPENSFPSNSLMTKEIVTGV